MLRNSLKRACVAFALACITAPGALAQVFNNVAGQLATFSDEPVLQVETGSHVSGLNSLASDAGNRYIVSGGLDKTVRLWSRDTGELLKVIRPPIGEGNRGNVTALAMSPDGSSIAVGGNYCIWHAGTGCVLLFDTASGRMTRRIENLPALASALTWSTDGILAVGMGERGVRVYRVRDWAQIGADENHAGAVNDIHTDGRGHLVSASEDQVVRLYAYSDAGLKLLAKKSTADFKLKAIGYPRAVRFSPDGRRIAVGQQRGAPFVSVHDASTLELQYLASTNWGQNIGTGAVAWSPDGEYLYAGMSSFELKPIAIRRWGSAGRGFPTDLPAGNTGITRMSVLQDGSVAFVTIGSIVGLYEPSGRLAWDRGPLAGRFHDTTQALRVSDDGTKVQFDYDGATPSTINFDLGERRIAAGEVRGVRMRAAATAAGNLNFFNQWRDTRGAIQVASGPLAMSPFETARSVSIAPDNQSFVVGTNNQVRNYAADGRQLWAVPAFEGFAVNHSGDGRLVVVATGDGTVRWIDRQSGRYLATLYVAPDRKRWVLATPSGFYDASVGAEDFLGWHINRGPDSEADFIPVSRLRSRFYRPEVVARILKTGSDAEAVKLAAAAIADALVAPARPSTLPAFVPPPPPAAAPPVAVAPSAPAAPPVVTPPAVATPPVVSAPPKPPAPPVAVAPPPTPPIASSPPPAPAVVAPPAVVVAPPKPTTPPAPPVVVRPSPPQPAPPVATAPMPAPAAPTTAPAAPAPAAVDVPVESTAAQTVVDITKVLPPVVTILSPAPGSTFSTGTVTVKYLVRTEADAPLLGVRARVNGLSRDSRTLTIAAAGEVREITVNVPQEDSEVLLFAENRHGISAAASLKLTYRGAPAARAADSKPVLYVLAVGVSDYENPQYRLNFASKDARDFISVVQKQKGRLYSDVVVKLLTDREATSKQMVEGFEWLQKNVTDKDVGMAFIAGHGLNDDKGRYYFLPANIDLDRLPETGVPFTQIRGHLSNLKGKGLLFVDTCHSGDVMGGRAGYSTDVNGVLNELSSAEYGLVVLASSTGKQYSLEDPTWGNGAFTKALVEGLNGQADLKRRGRITHKMLDFYVSDRVDELTSGKQTPVNPSPQGVPDYPIAATGI